MNLLRFRPALLVCTLLSPPAALGAADCDANGSDDALDIAGGRVPDCNGNGLPDVCDLATATLAFVDPEETLIPGIPHFLAGGDLDGDGDRDAVAGVHWPAIPTGLLVVLDHAGGSFTSTQNFTLVASASPGEAVVVDLAGNSAPEVVIWYRGSQFLQLLRNNGSGLAEPSTLLQLAQPIKSFTAADFDGDGDADFAAAYEQLDHIVILDSTGWVPGGQEFEVEAVLQAMAPGDLDRDGDVDLAAAVNTPNGILVFRNHAGRFSRQEPVPLGWPPSSLAASDLDGDGHLDLQAGGFLVDDFALLRNTGGGVFAIAQEGRMPRSERILPADVDGDGDTDVVLPVSWVPCSELRVSLLENDGDGRLGPRSFLPVPDLKDGYLDDLDGDGRLDFVGVRWRTLPGEGTPRGWLVTARSRLVEQSEDCNANGVPDECDLREGDCDWNGVVDSCEVLAGARQDCDGDLRPDECAPDCNHNNLPDVCDIAAGTSADANASEIPDECEPGSVAPGLDCNENGADDASELVTGASVDCNANGLLDECDLAIFRNLRQPSLSLGFQSGQGALADLNGDGRDDLILGNAQDCCTFREAFLAVFLSSGQPGIWHDAGRYTGIPRTTAIVPADLDGDGDLDVLAGGRRFNCLADGRITVLRNQGHAILARGDLLAPEREIVSLAVLDFDRDGRIDVAGLDQEIPTSALLLFRGAEGGAFEAQPAMALPGIGLALASADFDGDGDADLAATTTREDGSEGRLHVHWNEAGDFSRLSHSARVSSQSLALVAMGSTGAAGRDLLVGSFVTPPNLALFRGGESVLRDPILLPVDVMVDRMVAGDQDGDGDDDIAIAGPIFVPGTSPDRQILTLLRNEGGALGRGTNVFQDFWPTFLAAGDPDADGDRDLALADLGTQRVVVIENRGQGRFGGQSRTNVLLGPVAIVAADFDGDGDQDLATANARSADLRVLVNDGQAGISVGDAAPLEFVPRSAVPADLDGDARADLAAAGSFHMGWALNRGDGGFAAVDRRRIGSNPVAIAAADLDRDGDMDLVTANQLSSGFEDNVSILLNDGRETFLSPRHYAAGLGVADLIAADLDGDGTPEIAVPNAGSHEVALLWGDGAGAFSLRDKIPVTDAGPVDDLLAVDVDGDRDLDLLGKSNWNRLVVLDNRGPGEFDLAVRMDLGDADWPFGSLEWSFDAADMDGDGDPDLVAAGRGAIIVSRGTAGRFTRRPESLDWDTLPGGQGGSGDPSPPDRVAIAIADLDADGDPDPAVSFELPNAVVVFLNRLDEASRDRNGSGVPDECEPGISVPFIRGDVDASGVLNVSDPVVILRHLFAGAEPLACREAADADDNGVLEVTDPIRILRHLFLGDPPLAAPSEGCGFDDSSVDLGCGRFPVCAGE